MTPGLATIKRGDILNMARFDVGAILKATGGSLVREGAGAAEGVSTDTRTIKPGNLFVPLTGDNFDGHEFIGAAFAAGAAGTLAARGRTEGLPAGGFVIEVADTLLALQDIAAYARGVHADARIVGVTGSNGKTTTKEMLAAILSLHGPVLKNEGNLNNHIGLPLTLVRLEDEHWAAVLEMGMNSPGEITRLAEICRPDVGVITNVGQAHIGKLGSVRAVAEAKAELVRSLPEDGVAVLNADDPNLAWLVEELGERAVRFGMSRGTRTTAESIVNTATGVMFTLVMPDGTADIKLPVMGQHNVMNALAAAAAAGELGFTVTDCAEGLSRFTPPPMRMQVMDAGGVRIINDAYNANPSSMAASLTTLFMSPARNKVAVLGDMLELGDTAEESHRNVGRLAGSGGLSFLVAMGGHAGQVAAGAEEAGMDRRDILVASGYDEAAFAVLARVEEGDAVLVKGSRGMRLEETVKKIIEGRRRA